MSANPTMPMDLQTALDAATRLSGVLAAGVAKSKPDPVRVATGHARIAVAPVAAELLAASGRVVSRHQAVIDCADDYVLHTQEIDRGLFHPDAVNRWGAFVLCDDREKYDERPTHRDRPTITPKMAQRWLEGMKHRIQGFHCGRTLVAEAQRAAALRAATAARRTTDPQMDRLVRMLHAATSGSRSSQAVLARVADIAADRTRTVDDRMQGICATDNTARGWNSPTWARLFNVSEQAVRNAPTWKAMARFRRGD